MESLYNVSLDDSAGVTWALTRYAHGRRGMWLMGPPELSAKVDVKTRATTTQVGATPIGWSIDKMEGSLKLGFHAEDAPLAESWRLFVRNVTPFDESVLRVVVPGKTALSCRLLVKDRVPDPGVSPATLGLRSFTVDVPVVCYEGCWRGETTRHTGEVVIHNPGDLPLWPRVRWQGNSAVTVTAPGVGQVELPRTGNRVAVLDTDPAKASMITVGGEPAPDLWRRLRGRVFPQPIPPRGKATWVFGGGATGMVTPLFTSMWR